MLYTSSRLKTDNNIRTITSNGFPSVLWPILSTLHAIVFFVQKCFICRNPYAKAETEVEKGCSKKRARKMLMELTPGVNFINIIRTNFSYKRRFSSYFLALSKNSYEKCSRITLMKLTADSRSYKTFFSSALS